LCKRVGSSRDSIAPAIEQLVADGRVERNAPGDDASLTAATYHIPVGAEQGWESAVYDHFQAMASAIANKLRSGRPRSSVGDLIGGATLSFDLYPGHPEERAVYGLLESVRSQVNEAWGRVRAANTVRPVNDEERIKVTFYFGQDVDELDAATATLQNPSFGEAGQSQENEEA